MAGTIEVNSVDERETGARSAGALGRSLTASGEMGVIAAALVVFIIFGFSLRLSGISSIGFAEDEINKIEAVRVYERGDITPNAEHPMLMKSLIYLSMQAAQAWNARAANKISDEAAVRFPNVLFGALTILPLYLLTAAFFDRRTGLIAAALWAVGINAITYNRIAKEDTLLVFFMLFAFYFYLRGKQTSGYENKSKRRSYILSGASFGLMMASKYFPHYFGLNSLYHYLYKMRRPGPDEPHKGVPRIYYITLAVVFLIANPAVLLPQTWQYLNAYTSEQLLTHTGYLMGDHLYKNNVSGTPFWGTPFYFYALFLAIKVPLPLIVALITGLLVIARRWRHPGHGFLLMMFLLWIIPYSFFGAKWLRYTLSLMPFVYMIAAVGIVALIRRFTALFKPAGAGGHATSLATVLALLVFIAWPAWTAYANAPHYAVYTNALGRNYIGYFFPHDEFYDDGLREAIRFVCDTAPQGATIAHETPAVARYYLQQYGRTDLRSHALSAKDFKLEEELTRPAYFIVQRGRTYFENQEKLKKIRATLPMVHEVKVRGTTAVEVYATQQSGQP